MSLKKAQTISKTVNSLYGVDLTTMTTGDVESLKGKLEEFLDLEIDTDELSQDDSLDEELDEDFE